jgi:predicted amidohydrolase
MAETTRIAVVQSRIENDIATNGSHIRAMLDRVAAAGARLALFPEGALSGYAKAQVKDWDALDWPTLAAEQVLIRRYAAELGVIAVVGSATPVIRGRPHNSLHVLPINIRYDKRLLSYSEVTDWYMPGFAPMTFAQDGFSFGLSICIEVQFPELFAGYEALGVDCILHATYGMGPVGDVILRGHAATTCLWIAAATCANADTPASGIVGPNGNWLARCGTGVDMAVADIDRSDPQFDIALNKARPWRRIARQGQIYRDALTLPSE